MVSGEDEYAAYRELKRKMAGRWRRSAADRTIQFMGDAKFDVEGGVSEELRRAAGRDEDALRILFALYHDRLKRMVHLRLSRRLAGRVDDSDVVQEAFTVIAQH